MCHIAIMVRIKNAFSHEKIFLQFSETTVKLGLKQTDLKFAKNVIAITVKISVVKKPSRPIIKFEGNCHEFVKALIVIFEIQP